MDLVRKDHQYAEGVENRPELDRHFQTNIKGLHIVGSANGSPLLKTCVNEGVEVVRCISRLVKPESRDDPIDLVIVGAGPAGLSAALEARKLGYSYLVLEKIRPLDTILNFPQGKHVYAEPASLATQGEMWLEDSVKEELLEKWGPAASSVKIELGVNVVEIQRSGDVFELRTQAGKVYRGRRVVLAVGRMGNPRRLKVPGEDLDCVYSKLLNPGKYQDQDLLVVGGGNSAAEAVLALMGNNRVTMIHRGYEFPRLSATNRSLLLATESEKKIRIHRKSKVLEFRKGETDLQVGASAETSTRKNATGR